MAQEDEIEQFNQTIDSWISELPAYSLQELLKKPDSNSWSMGQLYEHLIEETNWYIGQIAASLDNEDHADKDKSEEAKALFRRGSFEDRMFSGDPLISNKVKQPASVGQLVSDMKKLKADVNAMRERMQGTSCYGKSEHPGLGFFTCYEWMSYIEMHMRHHLKQKDRIKAFLAL